MVWIKEFAKIEKLFSYLMNIPQFDEKSCMIICFYDVSLDYSD